VYSLGAGGKLYTSKRVRAQGVVVRSPLFSRRGIYGYKGPIQIHKENLEGALHVECFVA
jgi:hypothetical protein